MLNLNRGVRYVVVGVELTRSPGRERHTGDDGIRGTPRCGVPQVKKRTPADVEKKPKTLIA